MYSGRSTGVGSSTSGQPIGFCGTSHRFRSSSAVPNDGLMQPSSLPFEGLNSKIQTIKKMAYCFRNREHFKTAIYFHCGGLDLYPATNGEPG